MELSTPVIPFSDDVLVMPLIGAIDSRRAQQAMETLLQGVAESQARAVILDITGVPVVDTQVANTLMRVSQAAGLLGTQVVLTGIRPEVAQTIVGLGVDLRASHPRHSPARSDRRPSSPYRRGRRAWCPARACTNESRPWPVHRLPWSSRRPASARPPCLPIGCKT